MSAYVDFTFEPAGDRRKISDWQWGRKVHGRITLPALELLYGLIGNDSTPAEVFSAVREDVLRRARAKIQYSGGDFEEPVMIEVRDI